MNILIKLTITASLILSFGYSNIYCAAMALEVSDELCLQIPDPQDNLRLESYERLTRTSKEVNEFRKKFIEIVQLNGIDSAINMLINVATEVHDVFVTLNLAYLQAERLYKENNIDESIPLFVELSNQAESNYLRLEADIILTYILEEKGHFQKALKYAQRAFSNDIQSDHNLVLKLQVIIDRLKAKI